MGEGAGEGGHGVYLCALILTTILSPAYCRQELCDYLEECVATFRLRKADEYTVFFECSLRAAASLKGRVSFNIKKIEFF